MVCWQPKIEHRCIIHAEKFVAEILLFDRKFSNILTATVRYNQKILYEVEGQKFFGHWCLDRKLKQRWNHSVMATKNWSSLHYILLQKFFFLTGNIQRNTACYIMVLEYSMKTVAVISLKSSFSRQKSSNFTQNFMWAQKFSGN